MDRGTPPSPVAGGRTTVEDDAIRQVLDLLRELSAPWAEAKADGPGFRIVEVEATGGGVEGAVAQSTCTLTEAGPGRMEAEFPLELEGAFPVQKAGRGGEVPLSPGLYLVATPIGNLEDITLRALRILRSVDRIACEDTRQTSKLLNHFGIKKPTVSYHLHNEQERAAELIGPLREGGKLAVVSDAGMPGIADPGEGLVRAAIAAGIPVFPAPGANAALSALIASGLSTERFTFHGFLPSKEGARRTVLEQLRQAAQSSSTEIFYETPHRILGALEDVVAVFGSAQHLVVARELTKLHEEFLRGSAVDVLQALRSRPVVRGEIVLLLDRSVAPEQETGTASVGKEVADLIRAEALSEKEALKRVAKARGLGKSDVYREWQRSKGSQF